MVGLYGELLAWVVTRLDIPIGVAAQMFDNRACTLLLRTTAEGAETLGLVRRHALERAAAHLGVPTPPSPHAPCRPRCRSPVAAGLGRGRAVC